MSAEQAAGGKRKQASISTRKGDGGVTRLGGGQQISKADARVEAYGAIDELNTTIGLARTLCDDAEIHGVVRAIQRELFAVGSAISTKPESKKPIPEISKEMVARLDAALVERFRSRSQRVARLVDPRRISRFRRVRRCSHDLPPRRTRGRTLRYRRRRRAGDGVEYLNRLSDVLWLIARVLEARAGVDARLRDETHPGPPWSRAW